MNIRQKISKFVAQQRAIRELEALDNRQLDDLGIARHQISSVIRGDVR